MENIKRQEKLKDIIHKHVDERVCHQAAVYYKHLATADGKAVLGDEIDNFILKHTNDGDKDKESNN